MAQGSYFYDRPSQQDQYVDNRQSIGRAQGTGNIYEDRFNQMLQNQALVDVSAMFSPGGVQTVGSAFGKAARAIPTTTMAERFALSKGQGLTDGGRRQALGTIGAGGAAGIVATQPLIKGAVSAFADDAAKLGTNVKPISFGDELAKMRDLNKQADNYVAKTGYFPAKDSKLGQAFRKQDEHLVNLTHTTTPKLSPKELSKEIARIRSKQAEHHNWVKANKKELQKNHEFDNAWIHQTNDMYNKRIEGFQNQLDILSKTGGR